MKDMGFWMRQCGRQGIRMQTQTDIAQTPF